MIADIAICNWSLEAANLKSNNKNPPREMMKTPRKKLCEKTPNIVELISEFLELRKIKLRGEPFGC